ncbi:MAG: FecR domain-containing protein [Chitinophagaceae bacterium]|nr:FecR domain-containing protein [Chitinophagaceae bacterium]
MDLEQIKILLERYNQGTCTPEEAVIVEKWFDNIGQQPGIQADEDQLELDLGDIKSRIDSQIAPPVRRIPRWYAVAVAAVLLIIAGIFWYDQRKPDHAMASLPQPTTPAIAIRTIRNGTVEVITPRMVKDTILLPDGSTIVLNAGSRLRYPEHFSNAERSFWLEEGEAYFDAAHDPARPFVVHSGPLTTTALSTTFNIRTYATENKVTVALFTGKVKVDHPGKQGQGPASLVLLPSEQISFNLRQFIVKRTSFAKPEDVSGWKTGSLVFNDASFDEIATGVENHFGVTVINQSSKTIWNYTGTFHDESLKEVMETICLATSLSYTIRKDTVILVNKY